jgi:hypothetical protein
MSLSPATYEEALERAQKRQSSQKPRKLLKTSHASRKRPKRPRKLTTGQLKKKVWTEFSIYIRTRGADHEGYNACVTCLNVLPWRELQAGHFIRGRLNANLFSERGCHPQCYGCNIHRQGHVVVYYRFMLKKYGEQVIDELIEQNNQTKKWAAGELAALYEKYRSLNQANPLVNPV